MKEGCEWMEKTVADLKALFVRKETLGEFLHCDYFVQLAKTNHGALFFPSGGLD